MPSVPPKYNLSYTYCGQANIGPSLSQFRICGKELEIIYSVFCINYSVPRILLPPYHEVQVDWVFANEMSRGSLVTCASATRNPDHSP